MSKKFVFGRSGDIEYSLYRDEDWEGVKDVLNTAFFPNECVCRGVELNLAANGQARDELVALSADTLRDGVSIVARDVTTDAIVGHCINKMQYLCTDPTVPSYFDTFMEQHCSKPNSRALINFMSTVDGLVDLFGHADADCLFELMFLGTLPAYEGRSIGRQMSEYSIVLARRIASGESLDLVSAAVRTDARRPRAVSAIFTSAFSRRIGQRLGFEEVASKRFEEFTYDGKTFAERIADERHDVFSLCLLRL